MAIGHVSWISYTPVKGLRLVQLDEAEVTDVGLPGDRRFHLIDERGHLTNSKRIGALQQVSASWDEDAGRLALHFPDGSVVEDGITLGEANTTNFYGRPVQGALVEGPFSDALSEFAGTPLRLVQPGKPGGGVDRGRKGAVTILSEGSLERLAGAAEVDTVDGRRFRMNLGVAGIEPHAEDDWIGSDVQIGEAVIRPRGNVGRCAITKRHPETGETDLDTLNALATYRRHLDTTEELAFGVYGEVLRPGLVRLGDPVSLDT
jgi:uncharacterized protein YcbX